MWALYVSLKWYRLPELEGKSVLQQVLLLRIHGPFVSLHPELQPLKGFFFFLRFQCYKASDVVKSTLNVSQSTPSWIKMSQKCCKHSQPYSRGQFKQTLFCSFVWKSNFWSKELKTFSPTHYVVRRRRGRKHLLSIRSRIHNRLCLIEQKNMLSS